METRAFAEGRTRAPLTDGALAAAITLASGFLLGNESICPLITAGAITLCLAAVLNRLITDRFPRGALRAIVRVGLILIVCLAMFFSPLVRLSAERAFWSVFRTAVPPGVRFRLIERNYLGTYLVLAADKEATATILTLVPFERDDLSVAAWREAGSAHSLLQFHAFGNLCKPMRSWFGDLAPFAAPAIYRWQSDDKRSVIRLLHDEANGRMVIVFTWA